MATPDFVLELRSHVGHALLWMPGTTVIIMRPVPEASPEAPAQPGWSLGELAPDQVEILCVQRSDNGAWTPVTGIVDPGEEPAAAAIREAAEETNTVIRPVRLLGVQVVGPVTYDNGDQTSYLDVAFSAEWVSGDPYPADGENTQARFFRADRLPQMNKRFTSTVERALSAHVDADFLLE